MRHLIPLALLAGCASIVPIDYGTPPPADWPRLEEFTARVVPASLARYCGVSQEIAGQSVSCAVINFRDRSCWIYLTNDDPAALTHERAHCAGYSHVGESAKTLAAWERYKASAK